MLAILLVSILCAAPSQADPIATSSTRVEFKDIDGNAINAVDGKYNIQTGQTFTADVYFTSSAPWAYYDVAFGWGTTDKQGEAATDLSGDFTFGSYAQNADVCKITAFSGTGGFTALSGFRPYGSYIASDTAVIALNAGTEYKLVTYLLTNKMALGNTGTICLYNAGYGISFESDWTTKVWADAYNVSSRPPTVNYTMTSIPEPSSMMAMGCAGVGVLGDLLRRRRKRSSAKN